MKKVFLIIFSILVGGFLVNMTGVSAFVSPAKLREAHNSYRANQVKNNLNNTYNYSQQENSTVKFNAYKDPNTDASKLKKIALLDVNYDKGSLTPKSVSWSTGSIYNGPNGPELIGPRTPVYDKTSGLLIGYNVDPVVGFYTDDLSLKGIVIPHQFIPVSTEVDLGSNFTPPSPTPPSPKCGPAESNYFSEVTEENFEEVKAVMGDKGLCAVGDSTSISTDSINHTLKWFCKSGSLLMPCQAHQPYCNISSFHLLCPNEKVSLKADFNPTDVTIEWTLPSGEESNSNPFEVSFENPGSYNIGLKITTNQDYQATAKANTNVHVQPASCTVLLNPESSSADSVTVGDTINIKINTVCLGDNPQYILDPDGESWDYAEGEDISNDGEAKIEVKKSGTITFNARVEGEDTSVSCSSQISAFTEGSEWWERKPE
jgi:hypothetical protein